jgi:cytochrome P450
MSAATDVRPDQGTDQEVAFLDRFDPRFQPDAPAVHAAREACWYARTPVGYAILRSEEMTALLRDRHLRQGGVDTLAAQGITTGPMADWMRRVLLNIEGEEHTRLRSLVSTAFTLRAVDALRPVMRAVTHELLDRFAAHGECEVMAAFADPYPSRIIGEVLGIPRERYAQFHGWANDLGLGFSYAVAEHLARIEAALQGLDACVDDLLAARRAAPGPDLISARLAAEEAGDHLHDEELRALVAFLVFAGQDTTRNQLGCALTTFLEHPAQWARLAEEPALAPRAVEEGMRVRPAVPAVWRVAVEDFEFRGLRLAAGTFLSLFAAAAHTDPRVFGAAAFDISRERPAQLSFGGGLHDCLGAPLARAELEEALPILAARLRAPELAGRVSWRPTRGIRGPVTLPIRFRAAAWVYAPTACQRSTAHQSGKRVRSGKVPCRAEHPRGADGPQTQCSGVALSLWATAHRECSASLSVQQARGARARKRL